MAQDIVIAGAAYSAVPAVEIPTQSGGTAKFYDCDGEVSITENGTYDVSGLASAVVNVSGGGGGIAGITELYSNDAFFIYYVSTSLSTAATITGITGLALYPFVLTLIENVDTSVASLKFIRSATLISNYTYDSGYVSGGSRAGFFQRYDSSSTRKSTTSVSYGLCANTINADGTLTISGCCNKNYFTSLTGTYKIRVYGLSEL